MELEGRGFRCLGKGESKGKERLSYPICATKPQISSNLLISRFAEHFGSAETNLPKVHSPITLPYLDITSLLRYPPCRPMASPSRKEGASMLVARTGKRERISHGCCFGETGYDVGFCI